MEELWIITKDFDVAFCQCSLSSIMLKCFFTLAKGACNSSCCDLIYVLWQLRYPVSPAPSLPLHHQNSCSDTNTHIRTDSCMRNDEFLDTLVTYSYRDMFRHECHPNHTHTSIFTQVLEHVLYNSREYHSHHRQCKWCLPYLYNRT